MTGIRRTTPCGRWDLWQGCKCWRLDQDSGGVLCSMSPFPLCFYSSSTMVPNTTWSRYRLLFELRQVARPVAPYATFIKRAQARRAPFVSHFGALVCRLSSGPVAGLQLQWCSDRHEALASVACRVACLTSHRSGF